VLVITSSPLLLVDHIHFQYNGLMLGLMLLSIAAHLSGKVLIGGALFAFLLNMKHLYLVLAPVQFVFIVRSWVWGHGWHFRLFLMGALVLAIFAASLGPFLAIGQLPQLLSRYAANLHGYGFSGLCETFCELNQQRIFIFCHCSREVFLFRSAP
jgi:alpha-1,3-glucosyltransferase